MSSTSRKAVLTLMALVLTACNTGDVQVSGTGQAATQAGQLPGQALAPNGPQAPGKKGDNKKIFFQRVTFAEGLLDQLLSIDYASKNAPRSSSSDGIPVVAQDFIPGAGLVLNTDNSDSVTYLRSLDVGADALVTTTLSTQESQVRFRFSRTVKSFSIQGAETLSKDASSWVVAWADKSGVVSIGENLNPSVATLAIPSGATSKRATTVQWNASGDYLLVRTVADAVLYKVGSQGIAFERIYSGVSASAFSPDGSKVALVQTKDATLQVIDLLTVAAAKSEKAEAQINLDSSTIHDFSWNAHGFTYWARLKSGMGEVRFLSYDSDKAGTDFKLPQGEVTVAQLGVPDGVQDGVVCPSWSGDRIYFSDFDNGSYVIEKASVGSGKFGGATEFMRPLADSTDSEGFVCPKF
jgi:predicted small secreted protein